jgi:hypothetical protein
MGSNIISYNTIETNSGIPFEPNPPVSLEQMKRVPGIVDIDYEPKG